ncbi:NtaA/DmoA family FMN-dependent monooxygenase [Arthrobacter sedimenti]|uniref:NtaA/DmoA family FMN-dependent monooxygenase n=1 Tax=Arthrobacter sedimenti TaxID=2694931 RepID=UPI000B34DAB3|nr:NtaA/DmoA family FMN-dependent monooxygenase [Arthrobacter sedimenti]OUM45645.1 nitrilotriacetate monooxygenase [Arthrobacter agilis]
MTNKQMILGMELGNGYGSQVGSWRAPWTSPTSYTDFDRRIRYAQAAERGKFQFLFVPDGPQHEVDIEHNSPYFSLDAMLTHGMIARATKRIGLVATASTTFNEPFNIARQFKTLDVMSHGRAGWNAVTSAGPSVAANYGVRVAPSGERYGRAHESIQLVQSLWGSWGPDAWVHDQQTGEFTRKDQVTPINRGGKYVASRGPLYIPPSEQGQPVIFQAGASPNVFDLAGAYANGVIGSAHTIDDARKQRSAIREAAKNAGRDPDSIKFFAGFQPTVTPTKQEALERRASLIGGELPARVSYLGSMLGVPLGVEDLDRVLNPADLAPVRPAFVDPRAQRSFDLVREGWTVREVLGHGVIDYHPSTVGTAGEAADHMQEWFEAGAVDGFWVCIDVYEDGIDTFVDEVVPILQNRGLFHRDYEGSTLREHLGVPIQYGTTLG